ncbi:MAG: phospholipase [Nitrospirae bacterium]|nr:phospholipase [Nitrospirota bacterium]
MERNFKAQILLIFFLIGFIAFSDASAKSRRHETSPPSFKGTTVLEDRNYFDVLLNHINNSKHEIIVSMYVFKTSGKSSNYADRIKVALIKASQRGVDVRVLLELEDEMGSSLNAGNEQTARELDRGGVKVFFDSPSKRTHVKAVVIDGRFTFIGSHNLTSSALQYNNELSLMIESEEVAGETGRYIEGIIARSKK